MVLWFIVILIEVYCIGMFTYKCCESFQMRENYVNLKKAFMSFDRHLDGFISIEDLQAILTQFTIPMSKQLFCQLMEK